MECSNQLIEMEKTISQTAHRRDRDEKKSDCGEGNKAKKEKNTKGKQLGEFRLDKKKAMRTQKGARERTEEMKLAQALLNTACA